MLRPVRIIAIILLAGWVSACSNVAPCDEFAVPVDRMPSSCPPKPAPPATGPKRYCYSTLGQPDCFDRPQPGRTGYLGTATD